MKTAVTIAGSDCSGGAGIQADIKTMLCQGVYAMSVITALTAQNTMGVSGVLEVPPEFLGQQMDAVFSDIYPDAVKIGMVSSEKIIEKIADKLEEYQAGNIVADTVMVASSGRRLLAEEALAMLKKRLLPMADLITPNIPEAEILSGIAIHGEEDMVKAAEQMARQYRCAVLLKGGHRTDSASDLLYQEGACRWFRRERIANPNTHGTGCTLSSAIAANLAKGLTLEDAVEKAKDYLSGAISAMLDLGAGSGPMNHGYQIRGDV